MIGLLKAGWLALKSISPASLLAWGKRLAIAAIGGAITFVALAFYDARFDDPAVRDAALAEFNAAVLAEAMKAETERKTDDAYIRTLTPYDLCVHGLAVGGLHSNRGVCDGLPRF